MNSVVYWYFLQPSREKASIRMDSLLILLNGLLLYYTEVILDTCILHFAYWSLHNYSNLYCL